MFLRNGTWRHTCLIINNFFVASEREIFLLGVSELIPKKNSFIFLCQGPFNSLPRHAEDNNILIIDLHQLNNGLQPCLDFDWSVKVAFLSDCITVNTFDIDKFEVILHENDSAHEIEKGLEKATLPASYVSNKSKSCIAQKFIKSQFDVISNLLTNQEKTIFKLISQNHNNAYIAESLHVSKATVSKHKNNIKKKLHCNNMYEVLYLANQYYVKHKP
jgi:DNA-binding CsgD family transcriptional regulator